LGRHKIVVLLLGVVALASSFWFLLDVLGTDFGRAPTLNVADFGLKMMGDCLFVNSEYLKTHGETIRKLLRATAKGFRDAQADPHAAALILNKYLRVKVPDDVTEAQLKITLQDSLPTGDKPIGWQDPAEWRSNIDLLRQIGVIKIVKDPADYFTNEYLFGKSAS